MEDNRVKLMENIVYHILPGILTLLIFVLLGLIFKSAPIVLRLNIALLLGYFPIGVFLMKIGSNNKKPYVTIRNLTPYLRRISFNEFLLYSLGGFFIVFILNILLSQRLEFFMINNLVDRMPEWLSYVFFYDINISKIVYGIILVFNLIIVGLIKPIFDGIYFRGMLLSQLDNLGPISILISATFYSICHLFIPNNILIFFIFGLIFSAVTYYKKNIYISIATNMLFSLSVNIALFTSIFGS